MSRRHASRRENDFNGTNNRAPGNDLPRPKVYDLTMRKVTTLVTILLFAFLTRAAERVTVTGIILDDKNAPIENATVMVYSAGVKQGFDQFCPTCYVDCGKRTVTSADGAFIITGLSNDLLFNLLVVREGFAAQFLKKVDPGKGPAPSVNLKKRVSPEDAAIVRGKVIDAHGDAVRDVLVEQQGIIYDQGRSFGPNNWIDLVTVTNGKGEFEMAYAKPAKSMILQFTPRGMAAKLATLATGTDWKQITVTDGATIRGRLVHDGKPVANAELGLSTHTNSMGKTLPETRIGTNEKGEFAITNVPAGRVWFLHGKMDSLAPRGLAAQVIECATKDDGQEVNLGDIPVHPAFTLRGKVVLNDGKPIPANMRLNLFADRVPDRQSQILPPDGNFEFKGIRKGVYSLSPSVKDYQTSDGDPIEMLVEANVTTLVVTLRPAPPSR